MNSLSTADKEIVRKINALRFPNPDTHCPHCARELDEDQLEAGVCGSDDCPRYDEDSICPTCSGSGEGMYDGTTCRSCKGKGVYGYRED